MHKSTKACAISPSVRKTVVERDGGCCIICGRNDIQVAHYISRARLGLGMPENLVCLCVKCHREYDQGAKHKETKAFIEGYLSSHYQNWKKIEKEYKK